MPKIIENLESKLIDEARNQLEESGYGALTIRSVAKACGVGVGTVYNYFPSKDMLIASYLLGDWNACIAVITETSQTSQTPEPVVRCIYDQLLFFTHRHQGLFRDSAAIAAFSGAFGKYHGMLRLQLAQPLRKYCCDDFGAEFIAESLLVWTLSGKTFDELYGMIEKLF